jgi:hypothetical protein
MVYLKLSSQVTDHAHSCKADYMAAVLRGNGWCESGPATGCVLLKDKIIVLPYGDIKKNH